MKEYNFKEICEGVLVAQKERRDFYCDVNDAGRPPYYSLAMFPYPSGNAHMGHVRVYTISDIMARYKKLKGFNVLHPIGWDAFGLPAENAAIQNKVHPSEWTDLNICRMKDDQFREMGWSFDWDKEITTCKPDYYRWSQWIFLKLLEHGKAYRKESYVNWCPVDETVLANEQVIDGCCWRDGAVVEKRKMEQWFFKITDYSQKLWDDLEKLGHWASEAVSVQRNWINRSEGSVGTFDAPELDAVIEIFTTRMDTLFGTTAVVVAPEHPIVERMQALKPDAAVEQYVKEALAKTAVARLSEEEKTGVRTQFFAKNPLTGAEVPIFVGDYVLGDYGTGAVMCVPGHDSRDYLFAKKMGMEILEVISPKHGESDLSEDAFTEEGVLVNSGEFDGLTSAEARKAITEKLVSIQKGHGTVSFNLRDWSVSRQRYWGCPIPIVYCDDCGVVPVPEGQLPVMLPKEVSFENGKADMSKLDSFIQTECPKCGKKARRETDTLDTFFCSSWYAYRYIDPKNEGAPFDSERVNRWMPIDFYVGGLEHAALHMIYFRFFTKFFKEIGLIDFDEPADHFFCNGMVQKDGSKMSKSKGNVVIPKEIIDAYGADALRLYMMSDTPSDQHIDWDEEGIVGKYNFVRKIYRNISEFLEQNITDIASVENINLLDHKAACASFYQKLAQMEENLETFLFHNAVARIHELANSLFDAMRDKTLPKALLLRMTRDFLIVSGIFVPFMAEDLLKTFSTKGAYNQSWPEYPKELLVDDTVPLVVQINGKKLFVLPLPKDASQDDAKTLVEAQPKFTEKLKDKTLLKTIFVPNRIYNCIVK